VLRNIGQGTAGSRPGGAYRLRLVEVSPAATLGVIVATRGVFNPELTVQGRRRLLSLPEKLGIKALIGDESATSSGAVETEQDARRYAALFQANRARIDGILVSLPNFGGELGVM